MRRKIGLTFLSLMIVSSVMLAQGEEYVVEYGDVLDVIAASFDASVACIAAASDLTDPNDLRPGDTLIIPADCPPYDGLFIFPEADDAEEAEGQGGGSSTTTSGQGGGSSGDYVVEYGDVLDVIAQSFNASAACIAAASDLSSPHTLRPGDTLVIPADCPPYDGLFIFPEPEDADVEAALGQGGGGSTSDQGGGTGDSYTVQYGDVLDLIAQEFNVSVVCVAEASGVADINQLRPGDTLVLDADCPPYDGLFFQPAVEEDDEAAAG